MSYTKVGWQNEPSIATPVDEDNLDHMDQGIKDNDTAIQNLKNNVETSSIKVGAHLTDAFQGNTVLIGKYNAPNNAAIFQVANGTSDNDLKNLVTIYKNNSVLAECPVSITDDLSVTGDITSGGEVTNGAGDKLSEKANQDMFLLTASGDVVSVNAYPANAKDLKVTMSPIQSGSGDPSPQNIRPISGRSSVDVFNSPVNSKKYFGGVKNGTYQFIDMGTLNWSGSNGTFLVTISDLNTPTDNLLCSLYITVDYSVTSANMPNKSIKSYGNNQQKILHAKDNTYSTAEAFKTAMSGVYLVYELTTPITPSYTTEQWNALMNAFDTMDKTISLGQTVYGGVLDVTSGELTIDDILKGKNDLTFTKGASSGHYFVYASVSDANFNGTRYVATTNALCDMLPIISREYLYAGNQGIALDGEYAYILLTDLDNSASIVSDFETALANFHLCYELATPTTVQLTPTQIALLEGLNNVFSEDGTVELTYLPESILPPLPSADGSYTLKATVSGGSVSLAWDDGNGNRSLSKGGSEDEPKEEEEIEEPKKEDMR